MAKQLFKGFKQVLNSDSLVFENGYIYFVREDETKEHGFLYFNGKKYGTTQDVAERIAALEAVSADTRLEAIENDYLTSEDKTELEEAIADVLSALTDNTVEDVVYDRSGKTIYITFQDGSRTDGFDATDFIVDGMLADVTYDVSAHTLTFIWNLDAGQKVITVNLDDIISPYAADEKYIHLGDANTFEAIIGEISFENGLFALDAEGLVDANDLVTLLNNLRSDIIDYVDSAITELDEVVVKEVSVNGVDAEVVDNKASVVIDSEDIYMGKDLEYSGNTLATSANTIGEAFDSVVEQMIDNEKVTAASLNELDERVIKLEAKSSTFESSDDSIIISATTVDDETVTDLTVNKEEATDDTVAEGHIELKSNVDGALYAVMYFDGDDVD